VAAIWFGCNNAARDIVGEWTVYQRERMVSLKLPSYVFSKFAVAAVLSLCQCAALLAIVHPVSELRGDFLTTLGILWMSSLVGAGMGLCASAVASTTEAAIAMLPLILLPMIALGGGIKPVSEMEGPVRMVAMAVPSRWALEANLLIEAKVDHTTEQHRKFGLEHCSDDDLTKNPNCQGKFDIAEARFPTHQADEVPGMPKPKPITIIPRTPLGESFAILGGMLVFWLTLVLGILKRRDIQ
jgi:hypothetical protein